MVAFTFVIKKEGKSWNATRVASETEDEGEPITAEGDDTYRYVVVNSTKGDAPC